MEALRTTLAALTIIAVARMANAANTVWYTSGSAGAEGQVLNLTCDTSGPAGTCSYSITMHVNGDDAVGLIAWASDLHSISANDCASAFAPVPPSPIPPQPAGTGGCGAALLTGSQGYSSSGPITGTASLLFITLNHSYLAGELGTSLISETAGDGSTGIVWADGGGDYAVVSFAGGPALPHPELSPGGLVIRITNVPEPATVALVLFALAAHRRRSVRR